MPQTADSAVESYDMQAAPDKEHQGTLVHDADTCEHFRKKVGMHDRRINCLGACHAVDDSGLCGFGGNAAMHSGDSLLASRCNCHICGAGFGMLRLAYKQHARQSRASNLTTIDSYWLIIACFLLW